MRIRPFPFNAAMAACGLALASSSAMAGDAYYEVTITNVTRAQTFTPILVASHRGGVKLFEAGSAASPELAALAIDRRDVDDAAPTLRQHPVE